LVPEGEWQRITSRCARQGKGEFDAFRRIAAPAERQSGESPFPAFSARDKLIPKE
jgi:hypothetical protein